MIDVASATMLIGAIATLLTAIGVSMKNAAEGRAISRNAAAARSAAEQAARQVSPNHGSSVADAVKRIESKQDSQSRSIGGLRDDLRQDREHLLTHLEDSQIDRSETHRRLSRLESLLLPKTAPSPPERFPHGS